MKRVKRAVLGVLVLTILSAVAVLVWQRVLRARAPDESVHGSGSIEATEVVVAPKVSARIATLGADEGDHVKAGQRLATLECDTMRVALKQARAQVQAADAMKNEALARQRQAQDADAPLLVQYDLAKREHARAAKLFASGGITRSALDEATTHDEALKAQLDQTGRAVSVARAGVRVAASQVDLARTAVDQTEAQLEECFIDAPMTGVVMRRVHEVGELVLPGSTLFRIGDLADIYTWIYVPNEDVGRVKLGQDVDVVADTYPGRTFRGRVVRINEEAEFTPKSIQTRKDRTRLVFGVKVSVDNRDGALLPGMPVEATIHAEPPGSR